jgi:diguanylate cyclase (GGDEF)-like protein/PAS domain S-box-containing protein
VEDAIHLALITGAIVYCVMKLISLRREKFFAEAKAAEARFRGLTELSADWFWETDAEHRITWLSGGAPVATLFGTTTTYGKRFWEVPGVEIEPRALEAHLEGLARQQPFFDLEIARADERGARQVHIISGRSRLAGGRFAGYRGVGRDVTEQRGAERALSRAKDRLEGALDGGNLAEWHLDVMTGELDIGDGWVRFLGYPRDTALTKLADMLRTAHPDDAPAARAALVRVVKGELPEYSAEARLPMRGGGWKWLHARGRVTARDAAGRALRISGTFADIDDRKRAEEALREAEQRYRSLVELAPDGVVVQSGRLIEYANPAAARILRAGTPRDLIGMRVDGLIHAEDAERYEERMRYLEAGPGSTGFQERRLRGGDGSEVRVEVASISFLERGRLVILTAFRDVTEAQRAREALAEREQRFRDVAESSGEYVWETDAGGRYTYLSERVEAVLGYSRAELLGRHPREFMPLGEERAVDEWIAKHGGEGRAYRELVHRSITKSGGVVWQSVSGKPVRGADGAPAGWRGTAADVTPRKQAEARIEQLATRDALTGLANRAALAERAAEAILGAARSRSRLALLALDLDRFRVVNESLGHQAGDALLRAVAERLQNALQREATLARLGGDDFVLMLPLGGAGDAPGLAARLTGILARPFTIEGRALHVGASIGVALYPEHGRDFGELLKCADAALEQAKQGGRGTWRIFDPAMAVRAVERLRVENELRGALARSELVLHWLPAVRGRGAIVGAEALVRWQHPSRGLLAPEEFVPLAEESGLIRAVGEWTLERALSQAGAWQASLPGKPWFAINVSAPELAQGDAYYEKIRNSLKENKLDGSRLELEVTERVLLSHLPETLETLRRIAELGVRFAIDDFGTGYSSLAYLRRLPIDKLKIDRMFLRGIAEDRADQAIVRTIASLASTLGIHVAAEGVDNAAQLESLLKLGCEEWQGHFFSEPLDGAGFERLYTSSLRSGKRA